ncbi:hypothetical protein F2Q70_00031276 [Brassica cretica]|uniref:Uncharacterized protein n=1 Tax=Brassica cretica TaxID=69181 RepID=A0A8S9FE40_BRACR|nr:hypothetical protein F2Q70_00031276 [Brassica cretica]
MIDSGSDHGGSSRSVVTGGLGWTARFVEFWRRVSHGDGSIGSDLSAVCVDVGWCLWGWLSALVSRRQRLAIHSQVGLRGLCSQVVALVFGGGRNIFWFLEEALPWGDGAYEARGEHT